MGKVTLFLEPGLPKINHRAYYTTSYLRGAGFRKFDIEFFFHRLALPEPLRTYYGLPKIMIGGQNVWSRTKSIFLGWSHSVVISQLIVEQIVFADAVLPTDADIKEYNSRSDLECRFGRYVDDIVLIECNERVGRNCMIGLTPHNLPPKPSK